WKPRFVEGRSFTYFPSSIRDSAVCYFYEPDILEGARNFVYVIFLTTEDTQWHIPGAVVNVNRQQPAQVAVHNAPDQELSDLVRLREILDQFVAGLIELTERDLIEIEKLIDTHRN
ncbi:MAG: hypothetical protein LBC80_09885, partial [Treponema sp.]|nr:hypothetical protein [Treponema sp.]